MHAMGSILKEGRVSSMLKKIEEGYGVTLPVKIPESAQ